MTSLRRGGASLSKSEGRFPRERLIGYSRILRPAHVFCSQPDTASRIRGAGKRTGVNARDLSGQDALFGGGDRKDNRTPHDLAADGPDEPGQFPCHGGGNNRLFLSGMSQMPVSEGQSFLGLPGDGADLGRLPFVPFLDPPALSGGEPIGPGGFHQDAPDVPVSGLRDPAPPDGPAAGGFRGDQPQVGHELRGGLEPGEIPQFRHDGEGRDPIDSPECHERLNQRGQNVRLQRPDDLDFDRGDLFLGRLDGVRILLENDPGRRMGKREIRDPGPESGCPLRRLCGNTFPVPEEESGQALFQVSLLGLQVFPQSGKVPHRLVLRSGYPDRSQFPRPVEPGEHEGVPAIGLYPVPALFRNQGGGNDAAFIPGLEKRPVQNIPAGSRLVHEGQAGRVFGKLFGQVQNGGRRVGNRAIEPHLFGFAVTNGNGNGILVNVESDEFGILGHGLSSCILALDGS